MKISSFDAIWAQFDMIQPQFNTKFLGLIAITPLES
jgi:hypothetical protein